MELTMKDNKITKKEAAVASAEGRTLNSMRHVSIHNPADYAEKRVAIIGVGTIGSWLAQILARMQVPMALYDHDTVEEHNLTTQTYGQADIGIYKVNAIAGQLAVVDPSIKLQVAPRKFSLSEPAPSLIVSCVDSLDARKEIAQILIDAKCEVPIVDGRVGREQGEVYFFETASAWLAQLPEEADTDPCGARFTAYTAVIVAGFMANNIKRFLLGQQVQGRIIYDAATSTFIKE